MAKNSDLVAVLEYLDRKTSFNNTKKPHKLARTLKKKDLDFDPFDLLQKEKERLARFEQRVKDWERMNKKDEKKEDKKNQVSLSFLQWYIIGLMSYPTFVTVMTWVPK